MLTTVAAVVIFCLSGCALLSQCSDPPIHYVLPDGYVGKFQLILDETNGVEVKLEKGSYEYKIPKTGELRVKSFEPFHGCHKELARYVNGTQLPTDDYYTIKPDTVALRLLGTSSTNDGPLTITNVIGTQRQAEESQRELIKGKPREAQSSPTPR